MPEHGFNRTAAGVTLHLEDGEIALLSQLIADLEALIQPESTPTDEASSGPDSLAAMVGIDADAAKPTDPALARLFPDAYRDDDEAASEFRRFTERGLRDERREQLQALTGLLELAPTTPVLTDAQVQQTLKTLNDLRLVLGVRLEITDNYDDDMEDLPEDDPRRPIYSVYQWLTAMQYQLLHEIMGE